MKAAVKRLIGIIKKKDKPKEGAMRITQTPKSSGKRKEDRGNPAISCNRQRKEEEEEKEEEGEEEEEEWEEDEEEKEEEEEEEWEEEEEEEYDIYDPNEDTRDATGRDPDKMTDEQLDNLRAYIAQIEELGVEGLLEEFATIKRYKIEPFDVTSHKANPAKNRYSDIFCIEPTRVVLADGRKGDYIHANHVKGSRFLNHFIATQGPKKGTVNDFWRLVVQEDVGYIFMLCGFIELGKPKCEKYYPENLEDTKTYGDISVTLVDKIERKHFIDSTFLLESPGKSDRYVYHHYWKEWPDHGVPITARPVLRRLRYARVSNSASIVHCSAGVGRTGTLLAIEWMLQKICTTPPPYDMKLMLKAIRRQRANAIQTAPQYAYVALALFNLLTKKDPSYVQSFNEFSEDLKTNTGA